MSTTCERARALIADERRGDLDEEGEKELKLHMETCVECTQFAEAERLLDKALRTKLPRYRAPKGLAEKVISSRRAPRSWRTPLLTAGIAIAAAASMTLLIGMRNDRLQESDRFVTEAVNDHLRITLAEHPLDVESGGIHQVKPWFFGKVDFAPSSAFAGDDDYPLQGGSLAYFLDRRAAAFIYKRRLHTITMFVFRADGISLPTAKTTGAGRARATIAQSRGFNIASWREADLAYVAVSDVDASELLAFVAHADP